VRCGRYKSRQSSHRNCARMAELADALDSGAKTTGLANSLPSTQPAEKAGFVFGVRWSTLAGF
jgi:hypothetical protein